MREPHSCRSGEKVLLIDLSYYNVNEYPQVKCIAINPRR